MAKIYTKVGDKGQTSLVGGQKTSKDDVRLHAYGTIDELNSCLGMARAAFAGEAALAAIDRDIETLQHWLFDLGSLLAAMPQDRDKYQLPSITAEHVEWLERRIDDASAKLKPLRNFILPAGSEAAARLHVARTVARRAERFMVGMKDDLSDQLIPFINRLSDYLFIMARYANHLLHFKDIEWNKTTPVK